MFDRRQLKHWLGAVQAKTSHRSANHASIVTFHTITRYKTDNVLAITQNEFCKFCDFFMDHFDVISLTELADRLKQKKDISNTLVITFDDGYKDNLEIAARALKARNLPATFFVTSDFVGTDFVPWWEEESRQDVRWLSWDDVRELRAMGFEIGSHTMSHTRLSELSSEKALLEVFGGRDRIQSELGEQITHFAYPFGGENDFPGDLIEPLKDAGLGTCLSCYGGVTLSDSDPFELRRIPITSWYLSPQHYLFEQKKMARYQVRTRSKNQKKILIISYHLFPSAEVGAKRPSELAMFLANDYNVTCISSRGKMNEKYKLQQEGKLREARVIRLPDTPRIVRSLWALIKRFRNERSQENTEKTSSNNRSRNGKFANFYYAVHSFLDNAKGWAALSCIAVAIERLRRRTDIVIVSGPPAAAYPVGLFAKWINGAKLTLDLRDPWIGNVHWCNTSWGHIREKLEAPIERKTVGSADLVVCASPGIKRKMDSRFPQIPNGSQVILNGYDIQYDGMEPPTGGGLRMLYAGTLYLNRNPIPLFEALISLKRKGHLDTSLVDIKFVGDCKYWNGIDLQTWLVENGLQTEVELVSHVPTNELVKMVENANVMINFAQGQPDQIPAKTYEYLATGRDNLVITEKSSDVAWLYGKANCGITVEPEDLIGMQSALMALYKKNISTVFESALVSYERFSRKFQNERYSEMIFNCISRDSN